MAPAKKNVTVNKEETKPAAKAAVKKAPVSAEPAKADEPKAEALKAEEVKADASKAEVVKAESAKADEKKKAGRKPAVKTEEKKAAQEEPAEKKSAAKKELKSEITVQFGGKSYSQEELVKIAKDVWKYDLEQPESELVNIELYVKPEEHVAYYVMNKEFAGSFYL